LLICNILLSRQQQMITWLRVQSWWVSRSIVSWSHSSAIRKRIRENNLINLLIFVLGNCIIDKILVIILNHCFRRWSKFLIFMLGFLAFGRSCKRIDDRRKLRIMTLCTSQAIVIFFAKIELYFVNDFNALLEFFGCLLHNIIAQ
jgi:hypothetical protein